MNEPLARAITTVGIWISVSIILTFGLFDMTWSGPEGVLAMLMCVLLVCAAAGVSTAAVWSWKPGGRASD